MRSFALLLMLLLEACAPNNPVYTGPITPAKTSEVLWVDADPACGTGLKHLFEDPDDCLALEMLWRNNAKVAGLSTTGGNTLADSAHAIGQQVAEGRFAVYKGSNECTSPMVVAFKKAAAQGKITILALGPLTNIATIMRCEPTLKSHIQEVVFVGSRQPGERFVPNPHWWFRMDLKDLNVETDPDATAAILRSGVPLKLVPYKAGRAVIINAWEKSVTRVHLPEGLLQRLQEWDTLSSLFLGTGGIMPFDPVAVAYTLWPEQFTCIPVTAAMVGMQLEVQKQLTSHIEHCLPNDAAQVRAHILKTL